MTGFGVHLGYNGGQLQMGLTGGVGAGSSFSVDVTDSGCRDSSKFLIAEVNSTVGAIAGGAYFSGKIANSGDLTNYDTSTSYGGRIGASFFGTNQSQQGNFGEWGSPYGGGGTVPDGKMAKPLGFGASVYAGGGIQLTFGKGKCPNK